THAGEALNPAQRDRIEKALEEIKKIKAPWQIVSNPAEADWLVRVRDDKEYLIAKSDLVDGKLFDLGKGELSVRLEDALRRIAKAENLRKLTATGESDGQSDFKTGILLQMEKVLTEGGFFEPPTFLPFDFERQNMPLNAGDRMRLTITNTGSVAADVTVLYIDSGYGIQCIFPGGDDDVCKLQPKEFKRIDDLQFDGKTYGEETFVVLAVKRDAFPAADFKMLEQPTLESLDRAKSKLGGRLVKTELHQLFENAMFSDGST